MASFEIEWKRSARKELRKLPKQEVQRILAAIDVLVYDPLPTGVRKMVGSEHSYRLRVGDYRVIYTLDASQLTIEIVRIRHRKDVYGR